MEEALGIDVGGVIIDRANDDKDTSLFGNRSVEAAPLEGAFEAIALLTKDVFKGNVHIVSKCGPKTQRLTLDWMKHNRFFEATGIPRKNVHFCRKRQEKAPIAKRLKLTHFIDDRLEILGYLRGIVRTRILFQGRDDEIKKYERHLKEVVVVSGWNEVLLALQVPPFTIPEEDKICKCGESKDQDGRCQPCIEKACSFVSKLVHFQRDAKRALERMMGELTHPCRACDRQYYDFALSKVIREYMSAVNENWEAELAVIQEVVSMFVSVGRGLGITKYPLSERAWKELEEKSGN